jgi:hypothetical protein
MRPLILFSFLPFFFLAFISARLIFRRVSFWENAALAPALGIALILLTVGLLGRWTGNFLVGIAGGSMFCLLVAIPTFWFLRKLLPPMDFKFRLSRRDIPLILILAGSTSWLP